MRNDDTKRKFRAGVNALQIVARKTVRLMDSMRFGHQLGLVVTERSLRLALFKQRGLAKRVVEVAALPLDPEKTGTWPARVEAAAATVSAYLSDRGLSRTPINVGLVGDDIAFRRLYLPCMSKKELPTAMAWEGEKLFPFRLDQCYMHHRLVSRRESGDGDLIGINLVAAKKELIDLFYNRFRAAGFRIGQINFLPVFMAEMLSSQVGSGSGKNQLLVFLDDHHPMALFLHSGQPEFYQQFVTKPQPAADDNRRLTNVGALAAELISFLDLYSGQGHGYSLDAIILSGKYAHDRSIREAFAAGTDLPCSVIFDNGILPASLRKLEVGQLRDMFDVIATGLSEISHHPLIPEAVRKTNNRRRLLLQSAAVSGLTLLVVGNLHLQSHFVRHSLSRNLEVSRNTSRTYESSAAYQVYLSLLSQLDREKGQLRGAAEKQPSHVHLLLKELSRTVPDDITLTGVYFTEEGGAYVLRLEGSVRLSDFSPEITLARYVEKLNNSPFFDNVAVTGYSKKQEHGQFDLSFHLQMGARV